jgi:hypothetical protein
MPIGTSTGLEHKAMFSIGFTDEPLEYPYDDTNIPAAPGRLVLGKSIEEFLANLSLWSRSVSESHKRGRGQNFRMGRFGILKCSFRVPAHYGRG